jgi:hypothetical protein
MGYSTGDWSAKKLVLLSASADAFPTCRALLVGTGGTATVRDADGNTCADIPLQVGYNPIQIDKLTALGTAANVWALY